MTARLVEPGRRNGAWATVPNPPKATLSVPDRCPTPSPYNGAFCRRRRCPYCGAAWVRTWESVSRLNLEHYAGPLVMITVTPPGRQVLPWSCGRNHVHSPKHGCRVKDDAAELWSSDVVKRLASLRDAARIAVKRAGLPVDRLWLERVWEPQQRGVPHAHIVAGAGTADELAAVERFVAELRRLAPSYGFGTQLDVTRPMPAAEVARYLAGYLLGRSGRKGTVRANLADPRMPRSLIYLSRSLTRETGMTMRRMRVVRWIFAARAGKVHTWPALYGEELLTVCRVAVRLERETGPPERRFRALVHTLRAHRPPRAVPCGSDLGLNSLAARGLAVAA